MNRCAGNGYANTDLKISDFLKIGELVCLLREGACDPHYTRFEPYFDMEDLVSAYFLCNEDNSGFVLKCTPIVNCFYINSRKGTLEYLFRHGKLQEIHLKTKGNPCFNTVDMKTLNDETVKTLEEDFQRLREAIYKKSGK